MRKILLLSTGGTISSVQSEDGLIPGSSNIIYEQMSKIFNDVEITIKDILRLDSSNIQPEEWKIIATEIYNNMSIYDGIVVTHGTDTMAYTTSMISFMIQNPSIPVVFTGSQLPISHPLTDAIANLRYALTMALSKTNGIYLAFDRKIILGCRAVKVRTTAFHAFESVNIHSVGTIDSSGLSIRQSQLYKYGNEILFNTNIEDKVFLLKLTPGTNPNIVDLLIQSDIKGIVIEAFGAGGVQAVRRDFVSAIAKASKHNIPVVVTSQCLYEQSNLNIYQVGTSVLKQGAIEALDMTTEAAVTKLMWVLGQTNNLDEIRKYFSTSLAGEITL